MYRISLKKLTFIGKSTSETYATSQFGWDFQVDQPDQETMLILGAIQTMIASKEPIVSKLETSDNVSGRTHNHRTTTTN